MDEKIPAEEVRRARHNQVFCLMSASGLAENGFPPVAPSNTQRNRAAHQKNNYCRSHAKIHIYRTLSKYFIR